jgi:hypothetical protein
MSEPKEKALVAQFYLLTSPTIPSPLPTCHRSLRLLKRPLEKVGKRYRRHHRIAFPRRGNPPFL